MRMQTKVVVWMIGVGALFFLMAAPAAASKPSPRAIAEQSKTKDALAPVETPAAQPGGFLFFKINHVYREQGKGSFQALEEGSTLRSGDHYKIIFTPNQDCFVYIFQVDSANMVYSLFPMEQFGTLTLNNVNPLKAGETYYIPAEGKSFVLDDQTGTERIYFLAAFERDTDLEAEYRRTVEAQKRRTLDDQLAQIDKLLNYAGELNGEAHIVAEPDGAETTTWQEDGETFSVLQHRLENMCDGCVHVLTFTHQ